MPLFRKRVPAPARPVEFEFMSEPDWAAFNDDLREALRKLDVDVVRFEPGCVVLASGRLGLLHLAQQCHAEPRRRWPGLIRGHVSRLVAALADGSLFDAELLRVRLYPDDHVPPGRDRDIACRPFAESVLAVLVLDLPTTVRMVARSELVDHGIDEDDAFARAWEVTRRTTVVERNETQLVGGARVHILEGDSFFVTSLLPYLTDQVHDVGPNGAIVGIPRRHTVVAVPIVDLSVLRVLRGVIPLTRGLYGQGPGSVSAHLYWWRDGALTWLPTIVDGDEISFHPPDSFLDLLNDLPPAPDADDAG